MKYIGILGYGKLGQFIYEQLQECNDVEVSFVWNRTLDNVIDRVPENLIIRNIADIPQRKCDLVIEVCHPDIVKEYGVFILRYCDLLIGSPTALSDIKFRKCLLEEQNNSNLPTIRNVFVPAGAMWGIEDIQKLDKANKIKKLHISMEKHPNSIKLYDPYYQNICQISKENGIEKVIYEGSVKELCTIAPNNVNSLAAAALAASNFGFDNVIGCLKSNPTNAKYHIIEVEVETNDGLKVNTKRYNPASVGNVTGAATFYSFMSSIFKAIHSSNEKKSGISFC